MRARSRGQGYTPGAMATYFIGDVHGCADELSDLLDVLGAGPDDEVYLTGDAFDRGPAGPAVFDMIHDLGLHSVRSNHEEHLEDLLRRRVASGQLPPCRGYLRACLELFEPRHEEFLAYLAALPFHHEGPHAPRQTAGSSHAERWVMVHAGVHPEEGLAGSDASQLLYMRRWPHEDPRCRPWFERYTQGPLVIFGHNAQREPVLHQVEGRLLAAGLDTGCVYGGRLTALVLEEERLVHVPARQNYVATRRAMP